MNDKTLADLLALPAGDALDGEIAKLRGVEYLADWVNSRPSSKVSQDAGAAWPLLAEMLAARVNIHMEVVKSPNDGDDDLWITTTKDEWGHAQWGHLADAPLAICRAWATWKMGGKA